ncbi:low-specificity L-threonine aldolase [Aliiglaciecola litoralis]|uniref:Low-specificity L-threonine aldolase n=2 Tax=Aliiglaciecola litoralis TaxID=582857 RepID=A0ABP3WVK9_9ALTE
MAQAEVGDDVFGDDPTIKRLEQKTAEMAGHEAGLFMPSGTQSNLVGLLAHCQRGDEYIVGQQAHTYKYEAGGAAVLGSIQPQPIEFEANGTLDLKKVEAAIKPDDCHFARSRLLALENTVGGKVLPLKYLLEARQFTLQHDLILHLDGARAFNAAVALDVPLREITAHFDSVSLCLSKGLGAPVGSLLCGSEPFIKEAHKWRKMVGGGMRQAGILAAAGLYAIEHNVQRLKQDHDNAFWLAQQLRAIPEIMANDDSLRQETNMVFVTLPEKIATSLCDKLKEQGILIVQSNPLRIVVHKDVDKNDLLRFVIAIKKEVMS